jgi:CRISPR-associated endonuclease/helicase Cas3
LFTLTVPTGGGKTLASLSFALEHAVQHGLQRVVYVIPYTSIIEQTAEVFRTALGTDEDILEHHASFDWERAADPRNADDEGADGLKKLRLAAENWDVPIVVTTAVQFYESLFANRTSRCRKLHNLAKSVIVLDEAQMMPLRLLLPSMAAVDELGLNYGASVVLCTATQPALRKQDGFCGGFNIPDQRELAPEPKRLYAELKRFDIEWQPDPVGDDAIAARFAQRPQMLTVVNTRAHAKALFTAIKDMEGACHLSTLMCPLHRRTVLKEIKVRLSEKKPVRLVSTSLIECGVDIDFPEVWRAAAGLDTIIQAGGRCNREGGPVPGRVVVFVPAVGLHKDIETFWQAARPVLRRFADNPNDLEPIRAYFGEVYWQQGRDALDAAKVEGRPGILRAIMERADELTFPFASIADAFEMIEDYKEPVIVPWRSNPGDRHAEQLLVAIASKPRTSASEFRRLQQYTVSIPPRVRSQWLALGVLTPVHPALGEALLKFADLGRYDPRTGLDLDNPEVFPTNQTQI